MVAPIFKESGEVEYYLPEGTWYNLLTGKKVQGGRWQKEVHDYQSMPLLVRPNSILAVGNCCTKPDYDFADGVTLYLSCFEDGAHAETEITDQKGNTVMKVHAVRNGNVIRVHVEGENKNWSCKLLDESEIAVEIE